MNSGFFALIIIIALLTIGLILSRLYRRASKEVSYVRTGFGGQSVIMNAGAMVFPVLHETIPVNMNTLRLEVRRSNDQALITKDRMRVDVLAEFYVRVKPTQESIAHAAQTLGNRTMHPEELKELVEGKFVDALRAVAAEMAMTELHEQRVDFVQKVQLVVSEDLLKNGLELESVSLTGLDQTSKEYFNPDNAFDAEGLTKLTEEIELRKKLRNEIEQDTMVEIQHKNLEAERQKLEISRDTEYARLEQEREVETRRAAQSAEIAKKKAEMQQEAEQAEIHAKQQVDIATIVATRETDEENIRKQQLLREREVEKSRAIEIAEQDKEIAIALKSKEKSESKAEAAIAKASAVREEERVVTAQEQEKADRQKQIELIEAQKIAEREAIQVTTSADAQKKAAEDLAEAARTTAKGNADKAILEAEARAQSEKLAADAAEVRYTVDAEGQRALNDAKNLLSDSQISMQVKMAIVEHLPAIIRESVKPMEQIDGIKIIQVDGIAGGNNTGNSGESASGATGNLADQVVGSALKYRAQAPLIESLLKEVGLEGRDLNSLTAALGNAVAKDASGDE